MRESDPFSLPDLPAMDLKTELRVLYRVTKATRLHLRGRDQDLVPSNAFWLIFAKNPGLLDDPARFFLRCPNLKAIKAQLILGETEDFGAKQCMRRVSPALHNFNVVAPSITELDLSDSILRPDTTFRFFPNCPNLRILRLDRLMEPSQGFIHQIVGLEGFWKRTQSFSNLEVLSLVDVHWSFSSLRWLESLHLLKELDVSCPSDDSFHRQAYRLKPLVDICLRRMTNMASCDIATHHGCKSLAKHIRGQELRVNLGGSPGHLPNFFEHDEAILNGILAVKGTVEFVWGGRSIYEN